MFAAGAFIYLIECGFAKKICSLTFQKVPRFSEVPNDAMGVRESWNMCRTFDRKTWSYVQVSKPFLAMEPFRFCGHSGQMGRAKPESYRSPIHQVPYTKSHAPSPMHQVPYTKHHRLAIRTFETAINRDKQRQIFETGNFETGTKNTGQLFLQILHFTIYSLTTLTLRLLNFILTVIID